MKYIIKNCPARIIDNSCIDKSGTFCQQRNDCLLKQVVSKCLYFRNHIQRDIVYKKGCNRVADEILQILEIEECE